MGTSLQKIGLGIAAALVIAFLGYRVYEAGGLAPYWRTVVGGSSVGQPSISYTASPMPSVPGVPRPLRTPAVPRPGGGMSTTQTTVLAAINAQRVPAGAGTLQIHAVLQAMAQAHAQDMAARGYFSHTSPDGVTFEQRLASSGYASGAAAENIGLTTSNALTDIVDGWLRSPPHRENMLNTTYHGVGIGVASGGYQGQPAWYVVAVFGSVR